MAEIPKGAFANLARNARAKNQKKYDRMEGVNTAPIPNGNAEREPEEKAVKQVGETQTKPVVKGNQQQVANLHDTIKSDLNEMQEDSSKAINVRYPTDLLDRIEAYQEKNGISTRTSAIMELLEVGLQAVKGNGYIKIPEMREVPISTLREMQLAIGLKRMDAVAKQNQYGLFSMTELEDMDNLLRDVSMILSNLNFYRERMRTEGYTALAEMGDLANQKL